MLASLLCEIKVSPHNKASHLDFHFTKIGVFYKNTKTPNRLTPIYYSIWRATFLATAKAQSVCPRSCAP